jgi:hypothetical protein
MFIPLTGKRPKRITVGRITAAVLLNVGHFPWVHHCAHSRVEAKWNGDMSFRFQIALLSKDARKRSSGADIYAPVIYCRRSN